MVTANDESVLAHTKATREDWIQAGLAMLVSDGVDHVKVLTLAGALGVSRSSFYWYFKGRAEFLTVLLECWKEKNTRALCERAAEPAGTITQGVLNIFECWCDETLFDPRLDFAVREWARRSERVDAVMVEADGERVDAIAAMFRHHGYDEEDAFIRARVLYFMQIGYYVHGIREPMEQRLSYVASYLRAFTGVEPLLNEVEAFRAMVRGTV